MRSCSRIADVSTNTVTKLLVDVGSACKIFHDEKVVDLKSVRIKRMKFGRLLAQKKKILQLKIRKEVMVMLGRGLR